MRDVLTSLTLAVLAAAGISIAQAKLPTPPIAGYVAVDALPDTGAILGAPPAAGSPAELSDRDLFRRTRALAGQPRWALAVHDADNSPAALLDDYSCAMGTRLDPASAPALMKLFGRVQKDASAIIERSKDMYKRPRPFTDMEGQICTPNDASVLHSTSYPSGHSTRAWTHGLILSEMAPDRATQIMSRARIYGESRVVCGVHFASDVQAGRNNAAVLVAALHADRAFRQDMARAARELSALRARRAAAPEAAACALESSGATPL